MLNNIGPHEASRRGLAKFLVGAAAVGVAGQANAQYASGSGRYVPYNCYSTGSVNTAPFPTDTYTCKPVSDVSLATLLLNLEYLEASFYLYATTGFGLPAADQGDKAQAVSGARLATLQDPTLIAFARELAGDERAHVEALRAAIVAMGLVPASVPLIDLTLGFTYIMSNAGLVAYGQTFDAFANDTNFLLAAYVLEDLLATAYRGTITSITSPKLLDLMSGLLATEGYHAGSIRSLAFNAGLGDQTQAISYARSVLDGSIGTPRQGNDHGVGTTTNPSIVDGDANAIIEARNAMQVINIVFDGSALSSPTLRLPPSFFLGSGLSSPT